MIISIIRESMKLYYDGLNEFFAYSSVPNRRVGRNKRAGGKITRKN